MTHETIIFGLVPFLLAVIYLLLIVIYLLLRDQLCRMGLEPRCGCPYGAVVNQGMTGQ